MLIFCRNRAWTLKLRYVKHIYGPYAHNLNKVLEILEGHHIRGYGDTQKPDVEITLLRMPTKRPIFFFRKIQMLLHTLSRWRILSTGLKHPMAWSCWLRFTGRPCMTVMFLMKKELLRPCPTGTTGNGIYLSRNISGLPGRGSRLRDG